MKRIIVIAGFAAAVLTAAYLVITVYDENLTAGRMWETPAVSNKSFYRFLGHPDS